MSDLKQSGITVDGKPVLSGVYKYCGTYGMPLGVVIDRLSASNMVIDWKAFIVDMLKEGANARTVRAKIVEAIDLPPANKAEFVSRLDLLLSRVST